MRPPVQKSENSLLWYMIYFSIIVDVNLTIFLPKLAF
jgi:hypothetical protein